MEAIIPVIFSSLSSLIWLSANNIILSALPPPVEKSSSANLGFVSFDYACYVA